MSKRLTLLGTGNVRGFTLVELIVVVAILVILGTIGFFNYNGYIASSRNATRVSDIGTIKKVLDIFHLSTSIYPDPSGSRVVTFSGAGLWTEGTFGKETFVGKVQVSSPPKDPLTANEYTYSLTLGKKEYQLGYGLEDDFQFSYIPEAVAFWNSLKTGIIGNYNGKVLHAHTGSIDYVLAVPSITSSDKTETDYLRLISGNKLTFKGFKTLPSSYGIISNDFTFGKDQDVVLYSGKLGDLGTKQEDRLFFYKSLSEIYNQSEIANLPEYIDYSKYYVDVYNPTPSAIDYTCKTVNDLLKINCKYGDNFEEIALGIVDTGALLPNGKTSYIGQWTFGDVFGRGQSIGSPTKERNSGGMIGGLNRSIGTKWKQFTKPQSPSLYLGGYDINGDGNENIIYGYGGKLFLGDPKTGGNMWETKVLDIKAILGVESILPDGSKSIIVALSTDWYIGVINGKTGNLDWVSENVSGIVKTVKVSWPGLDYKVFDTNGDGIKEYHFKQWYNKYHSYKFFEQAGKAVGETLWSSEGYGDYNEGGDGYQPQQWSMGQIDGKLVTGAKGSNTFAFYSNNVDPNLSGNLKFKMPGFGKNIMGGDNYAGWSSSLGYFYDLNGDGNDEYIYRIDEELNNNKLSRVGVIGYQAGVMNQYFSISNPRIDDGAGNLQSFGNFTSILPLKNQANPSDSYLLVYGRDPNSTGTSKWMMLKYNGITSTGHKKNSAENESFNYQIAYDAFDPSYSVAGIYNNGAKDYVVLYKSGEYYFYTFTGTSSLLTPTTLKVTGGFYGNTFFDGLHDPIRERNKNAGVYLAGKDSNGNGVKEFVVTQDGYFRYYEIIDSGVTLLKQFGPYSTVPGAVIKWGISTDNNLYGIGYSSTTNAINYYKTNIASGSFVFTQLTNDNFYAGGAISDLVISRLGQGSERYNKLMMSGVGMFDARIATPSTNPIKVSNDFFYSYDMDFDGSNEAFIGGKAYTFNAPGNYTLKYNSTGWLGDLNKDGVADQASSYCGSKPGIPNNIFFTIKSGADGSQIVPDLDWGNGNGWCAGGGSYSPVTEDFDGDGADELIAGVAARSTRIISISGATVTEGNQLGAYSEELGLAVYDFDGDGVKEVIRGNNNSGIMKGSKSSKTNISTVANIPGEVKSTWGISGGIQSLFKLNGITYVAFRGADGQVSLKSWNGSSVTNHFNSYYLNAKKYATYLSVLADGIVPMPSADVLLGDFIGNNTVQVLVGGGDGYIYIIALNGNILKAVNIGSAIKRMIIGDLNEDNILDIVFSAEDGYVYQLGSSRIDPPSIVRDGSTGTDIASQSDRKNVGVNFTPVAGAKGYFIQLYNRTYKSMVFDWIDLGVVTSACIISNDTTAPGCIKATKNFYLNDTSIYEWRVQSYNDDLTSSTSFSNGFVIR